jgi:preprotein translocase subunit SecG
VAILIGILNSLLVLLSLFLICLVLIQRGKGGGLAGAFGGVGGSSAFGTKAGDVFTRVTIIVAAIWFSLTLVLNVLSNQRSTSAWGDEPSRTVTKQLPTTPSPAGAPKGSTPPLTKPTAIPTHDTPAAPVSVPAIPSDPAPSSAPAGKTP